MKKLLFVALLTIFALPLTATAENKAQGSGPNIYTECGIGGMLFNKSTVSSNVGAVISNVIWDAGITATTSALSSPHLCVDKKEKVATLILETLPDLEKDIAAGKGKYLTALSATAGCKDGAINNSLRSSYSNVVSQSDYAAKSKTDKAASMFNMVNEAASAQGCTI